MKAFHIAITLVDICIDVLFIPMLSETYNSRMHIYCSFKYWNTTISFILFALYNIYAFSLLASAYIQHYLRPINHPDHAYTLIQIQTLKTTPLYQKHILQYGTEEENHNWQCKERKVFEQEQGSFKYISNMNRKLM